MRLLHRLGFEVGVLHVEVRAVVIEVVVLPQPLDDLYPLAGARVALVVRQLGGAEHLHLRRIPAADHVKSPATP